MRLLDTSTIKLHEFYSNNIPNYAILSHRWNGVEVSFQDLRDGKAVEMPGFSKIERCCAQAAQDGWKYAWIDSCCIDRTSSAELSEAINSMFQWYRAAQVCYAYLADVPSGVEDHRQENSAFRRSKWFTRGWTLQELLAPSEVVFYNQGWSAIGTRSTLEEVISSVTRIKDMVNFETACAAQKMSWASKRETTRVEDMAYCLMGIFGVNMPPLYGEGQNAFMRLQLEILRISDDESIFAWTGDDDRYSTGLLALSPAAFEASGDVEQYQFIPNRSPYSMTNKGLSIEIVYHFSVRKAYGGSLGIFAAPLNCTRTAQQEYPKPLGVFVESGYCADCSAGDGQYVRRFPNTLMAINWAERYSRSDFWSQVMYFKQPGISSIYQMASYQVQHMFLIDAEPLLNLGFSISKRCLENLAVSNTDDWRRGKFRLTIDGNDNIKGLKFRKYDGERAVLLIYVFNHRVGVDFLATTGNQPLSDIINSFCKERKFSDIIYGLDPIPKPLSSGGSVLLFLHGDKEVGYTGKWLNKVEILDAERHRREYWVDSWTLRY